MQERSASTISRRPKPEIRPLNAQQVTTIAVNFLKSLRHKRGIEPKRVFIENNRYVVEAEISKKLLAKVQIDITTSEIKEYGIEKLSEESRLGLPVEPKAIIVVFAVSVAVSFVFALLDLNSILASLF
ncbi:MAG: hypothetical protein NWE78_02235 [Candidatus Bathyarchaeota archaeon]|nr:hypothetical protein [Candidatus Bathyarchaeota archaeon]